jgi:hypothetical protein
MPNTIRLHRVRATPERIEAPAVEDEIVLGDLRQGGVERAPVAGGRITSSNVLRATIDSTARRPVAPNSRVNEIGATLHPTACRGLQATGRRRGRGGIAPPATSVDSNLLSHPSPASTIVSDAMSPCCSHRSAFSNLTSIATSAGGIR